MSIIEQHIVLQIVKGIPKAPGDENSAEAALDIIDLLDSHDLALEADGWQPKIATPKGGGVWADSSISTGRRLLAAADGNVTETMDVLIGNPDLAQRHAILKRLNRMIENCHDFWQTEYQIDPVYLVWHSAVGAGKQYALLYSMDVDYRLDSFDLTSPWQITLSLEREPYWRGLAPGANPKEWTLGDYAGFPRGGPDFGVDDLALYEGNNHLAVGSIDNQHAWNPDDYTNYITANYIDIPADRIPGDAPALLQIDIDNADTPAASDVHKDIYISRWTKPVVSISHQQLNTTRAPATMYAASDAQMTAGFSLTATASDGIIGNGSKSQQYYASTSFGVNPSLLAFGEESTSLDMNLMRGTYAVFLRHSQVTGSEGDIELTLDLNGFVASNGETLQTLSATAKVSDSATDWSWVYFGVLTIPHYDRAVASGEGYGLEMFPENPTFVYNFLLNLSANRTTGTATFNVLDLVMLPLDEGLIQFTNGWSFAGSLTNEHWLYDNTGYMRRGQPGSVAVVYHDSGRTNGLTFPMGIEVRGSDLHLKPGVDNRLHFWLTQKPLLEALSNSTLSMPFENAPYIRLNIVPRWRGIRDT